MGAVEFIPGPVTATIGSLREIRSHKRAHMTRTSCFLIAAMALAAAARAGASTDPSADLLRLPPSLERNARQTAPAVRYVAWAGQTPPALSGLAPIIMYLRELIGAPRPIRTGHLQIRRRSTAQADLRVMPRTSLWGCTGVAPCEG